MENSNIATLQTFQYRPVSLHDLPTICQFPQNAQELFFMFPKANYPLTETQLADAIRQRFDATVLMYQNQPVGFANYYRCEPGIVCTIGNVIISPETRGIGAGKYLVETMIKLAITKYHVSDVQLSCFNTNTSALLLYTRLGFKPFQLEERIDHQGKPVVCIHMHLLSRPTL